MNIKLYFTDIIDMRHKIPEDAKKIKISISIDPILNEQVDELLKNKFYKKSRFIEYLIKKYIDENDN
jgi:metal-responsive CopG/Arc/MetJ family transcriptional regulator